MANYINIGSTCAPFSEGSASYELATNGAVYYIVNGGAGPTASSTLLRHTPSVGYSTSGGSNLVVYSDFQHKIWWNANVVISDTGRSQWRVITPGTSTNDGILSSGGTATTYNRTDHGSKVVSASSWTTLTGAVGANTSLSGVTFSADSGVSTPAQVTTLTVVNSLTTTATYITTTTSNVFTNMLGAPASASAVSYTSSGGNLISSDFYYLQQVANTRVYLRYASSALTTTDTSTVASLALGEYRFKLFIKGVTGRLHVALYPDSATPAVDLTSLGASVTFDGTNWRVTFSGQSYTFQASNLPPSPATSTVTAFPSAITMLKFGTTSSYLRWDGTQGNASTATKFTIADYWGSNMSTSNIVQQMQFYFGDMTPNANAPVGQASSLDIYKWYVLTSPSALTPNWGFISNVVAPPTGNVFITNANSLSGTNSLNYLYNTTSNANSEGWVLVSRAGSGLTETTNLALVYSNVVGGTFTPMCYANVASPGTSGSAVSWPLYNSTFAGLPDSAFCWRCVKCTASAGQVCAASPPRSITSLNIDGSSVNDVCTVSVSAAQIRGDILDTDTISVSIPNISGGETPVTGTISTLKTGITFNLINNSGLRTVSGTVTITVSRSTIYTYTASFNYQQSFNT